MTFDTKYDNCEFSRLYNTIATPSFLTLIRNIIDMIDKGESYSEYRVNKRNVTLEEEIVFTKLYKIEDYHKYLQSSIMKNNMRFYYIPDADLGFYSISYTIKSTIDETKDNNFISYFIGKEVKDDDHAMMFLLVHIILNMIVKEVKSSYNIDYDDLFEYCFNKKNITNSDYINACISIFHIFITLFRIMDDILNLKYKDGPEIIKMLSSNEHHFIILNHLYNFAITDNKDPGDYEIMVKNCFDCLFN